MRNFKKLLIIAFVVVGALLGSVGMASANQRFLPSGINSVSASKAKSQVLDYAGLNDDYGALLAKQTGSSSFNRADYHQRGYAVASSKTLNTSLTSGGAIAQSSGGTGTKTLVLVNIRTGKTVQVMVRCGNIRTSKKAGPCHCKPVRVTKVNRILVNKKFTKTVTRTCPSGQAVTITVNGRVRGWVKGRITAKVIGSAKIVLNQQISLQVTAQISVRCGEAPVVTPPVDPGPVAKNDCPQGQTRDSNNTCIAVAVACKADEVRNSAGNCVTQTVSVEQACKAKGGNWDKVEQTCTVIVVVGNCSNITVTNGSGNVVSTSQGGNCNTTTVTPPPENRPPTAQIVNPPKHVCSGTTKSGGYIEPGQIFLKITASDPDGDSLGTPQVRAKYGTVGLPQKVADGQWTVKYTAPTTPTTDEVVSATVSDGKLSFTAQTNPFPNPIVDLNNPSPTTC